MLTQVDDPKLIRAVWRDIESQMRLGGRLVKRTLGTKVASYPDRLILREDLGIWTNPGGELHGRRWCILGVLPLPATGNVTMVVQINPAVDPSSKGSAGCLARDGAGDLWICHTGRVGGGRKGISRSKLLKWTTREPVNISREDRKPVSAFPVARVGDRKILVDIADYVREIHAFKEGVPSQRAFVSGRKPFRECEADGIGERLATTYKIRREHGVVSNRLIGCLQSGGYRVGKDKFRDAFVGPAANPQAEFEIKPTTCWQDLYTGVGQLMLHATATPARLKVLVVPQGISREKRAAVQAAGIQVITYTQRGNTIRFLGLSAFFPKAAESAPVRGFLFPR